MTGEKSGALQSQLGFTWVDKAGLVLAVATLGMFLLVWRMLLMAAGSAPTAHLSSMSWAWTVHAETAVVLPIWLLCRSISLFVTLLKTAPQMVKNRFSASKARRATAMPPGLAAH